MFLQIRNHSIDYICKFIDYALYEYDVGFKLFKELFSQYFPQDLLVALILGRR